MRFQDSINMSLGYTFRQKRRIFPVLTGIALSTTLILVVIISGTTITNTITQQILSQGSLRQITVTPPDPSLASISGTMGTGTLDDASIASWKTLPHVAGAYPDLQLDVTATAGDMGIMLSLMNQPDQNVRPELLQGSWPQDHQVIVPDTGIRNKLNQVVDGDSFIGKTIVLRIPTAKGDQPFDSVPVTVSGVYKAAHNIFGQVLTFTSLPFLKHLVSLNLGSSPLTYQAATVIADQSQHVSEVAARIEKQGFYTEDIEDQVVGLSKKLEGITAIGVAFALFIFVLVSFSIGNLLASSVRQRQREIGIMFAIGFPTGSIGQMITGESMIIGLVGAIGGILMAFAGVLVFTLTQPQISLDIPWWGIPFVMAIAILLCTIASIVPARRAMRMDVIQTLREE